MPTSVIIPAHNEEPVIGRLLDALLSSEADDLEVIVVCNGCTDRTAEVARAYEPAITVIDTEVPSKVNALNLGDAAAKSFPRVYVDADVILDAAAIQRISEALSKPGVLLAAPRRELDFGNASRWVRWFYDIDNRMPSSQVLVGGSGVYAMNEAGRGRFGAFPNVIADDGFVNRQFKPSERVRVDEAVSRLSPPRRLRDLVKIKTRSHLGNMQLAERYPKHVCNRPVGNGRYALRLALQPWHWPALATYAYVKVVARVRARAQFAALPADGSKPAKWERDESSRDARAVAA